MGRRRVLTATAAAVAVLAAAAFTMASDAAEASKVVPIGQRLFGAYVSGSTASQMESDIGRKLDVQSFFEDWSAPFPSYVRTSGRTALIAWEPWGVNTQDVIDGRQDTYLRKWATAAKASGRQVLIRPWPEMNGAWTQWSAAYAGADKSTKSAEQLKSAWRHAHDIFRLAGASNVKWVFAANEGDVPSRSGNRLEDYYPGDSYVDVLGFDAYNWAGYNGERWRTHQQIFDHIYPRLSALSATKPIWLTEGSASPYVSEADKAAWFAALLADTGYPRLEAYILFSADKEQDWRYNSSPAVLNAFRKGLAVESPTPSQTPTATPAPTSFVIENESLSLASGEGSDIPDLNASGGSAKFVWWTDRLRGVFPPLTFVTTRLVVRASGVPNFGAPRLVVYVDGVRVGAASISAGYSDYSFSGRWAAGTAHVVSLLYTEGRFDTDVYVDKVILSR